MVRPSESEGCGANVLRLYFKIRERPDEKDARKREKFLKSGRGHEVIYKQLENTLK